MQIQITQNTIESVLSKRLSKDKLLDMFLKSDLDLDACEMYELINSLDRIFVYYTALKILNSSESVCIEV